MLFTHHAQVIQNGTEMIFMNTTTKNALIVQDPRIAKQPLETALKKCGIQNVAVWSHEQIKNTDNLPPLTSLVLYSCNILNSDHLNYLLSLDSLLNARCKVLILARQISIGAYRRLNQIKNIVTLQIPCNPSFFEKLATELIYNSHYQITRSPRFITNEPVRVMVMHSGLLINTRMRNYSSGGAFLEYNGIHLKIGDILKVNMHSKDNPPHREQYMIDAKVIWIQDEQSLKTTIRGVGVTFQI